MPDDTPPLPPESASSPPPRAFAQGVGVVLQTAGIAMFLFSCCICSVAGLWDPLPSRDQTAELYQRQMLPDLSPGRLFDQPDKAGVMLTVVFATVGGLAMASFGLGLQSDRRRAAQGALITTAVLTIVLVASGAAMWIGESGWGWRIWNALLVLIAAILTGFCAAALRQVLRQPPPAEIEYVTDAELETLKRH